MQQLEERNTIKQCFKCGTTKGTIVIHHITYIPERIVFCCKSCHQTLHKKIRRENKCHLSIEEIEKLSVLSSTKRYNKESYQRLHFTEPIDTNIRFHELLIYNLKTGNVSWTTRFEALHNNKLLESII